VTRFDVLFVTGVTCAGKTTLADELKARAIPRLHVAEVDDGPMPDAGHGSWLRWRGEQLLYEAGERWRETSGEATVVCGITWPHALIDSPAFADLPRGLKVGFLLLDIPTAVLRERLTERLGADTGKEYRGLLRQNRQLAKTLRRQVGNQRHGQVLKSAAMSPGELAKEAGAA
jgi:hypothetical protein